MKREKLIYKIIAILLAAIIVGGISYSLWQMIHNQERRNKLTSGCFETTTSFGDAIKLLSTYPITDEEGMSTSPLTFTITNTCSAYAVYQVNLETFVDDSKLSEDYVKVALDNTISILSSNEIVDPTIDNVFKAFKLSAGGLKAGESITFDFRMWMDYETTVEQGSDKQFRASLSVITASGFEPCTGVDANRLYCQILAQGGGKDAIEAKTTPDFKKISPQIVSYSESTESSNLILSSNANKTIGSGYTFNEITGKYSLVDFTTSNTYSSSHIGNYTCNSSSSSNCDAMYKIEAVSDKEVNKSIRYTSSANYNDEAEIYATEDEYGMSYYYRGNVTNNNVLFGGFQWKIVRINGDSSIRLIYNGTEEEFNVAGTVNAFGSKPFIDNRNYAWKPSPAKDNKYLGYMYGGDAGVESTSRETDKNSESYAQSGNTVYNQTDSSAKKVLEKWFEDNLSNTKYSPLIVDNIFCNDRQLQGDVGGTAKGTGIGTSVTNYAGEYRLSTKKIPTLKCGLINDQFTIASSNVGNKALTYPIGLITADEVSFAGGVFNSTNTAYYLNASQSYWTMTPYYYSNAYLFYVTSGFFKYTDVIGLIGLRAVINIDSSVEVTGDGTATNPFVVLVD